MHPDFFHNVVKRLLPQKTLEYIVNSHNRDLNASYSQEGEDILLSRLFSPDHIGFYIDIGSHHPTRFSNTYKFYKMGWRGINIDPMPGIMKQFDEIRPDDKNIEIGISKEEKKLTYYMFNEPALNTFDDDVASEKDGLGDYRLIETRQISTIPLDSLLKQHIQAQSQIDFMTIDTEGLDLEVLKSNDWDCFRPQIILVEELKASNSNEGISETERFLSQFSYQLIARTFNTSFYRTTQC